MKAHDHRIFALMHIYADSRNYCQHNPYITFEFVYIRVSFFVREKTLNEAMMDMEAESRTGFPVGHFNRSVSDFYRPEIRFP